MANDLMVVYDPEMNRENPVEAKVHPTTQDIPHHTTTHHHYCTTTTPLTHHHHLTTTPPLSTESLPVVPAEA